MDDTTLINKILNNKVRFYNENIETTIYNYPQYCGFVITSTINSSIYSWLRFYEKYKDKNQHQKTEMQGQTAQQGNHADCRRTEEDHK